MKTRTPALALFLSLILALSVFGESPAKSDAKSVPKEKKADKVLLFFMNPNGFPCQRQLSILDGIADFMVSRAEVVYVKTTNDNDLPKFRQYGIRGLPLLIITDRTGKELYRFSPGIQSAETIQKQLKK